jgi:hypothetical protein
MRWGAYGCTGAGSRLYPALDFRREKGGHPQLGIVLLSDPHPPFCQFEAGYHVHCFGRLKATGWPLSRRGLVRTMNSTTVAVLIAGLMIAAAIVWHAYSERRSELECREAAQALCEEARLEDAYPRMLRLTIAQRDRCITRTAIVCHGGIMKIF